MRLVQRPRDDCRLVALADPATLRAAANALSLPLNLLHEDEPVRRPGDLPLRMFPNDNAVAFGRPDPRNAGAVIGALLDAAAGCLRGEFAGMVTGPVQKSTINEGGIAYTGTTELLAGHAGREVVMMLANDIVRVALTTTHLPLRQGRRCDRREPAAAGSAHDIPRAADGFRHRAAPVVAVLGLNPHAGEDGHLGREEIDTIIPVLEALRGEGMQLVGPLPADTAFLPGKLRGFDAVLAMYHDQGMPVLKYSGFERAVNLTPGLPYPRVAVDHGTALDLAGRGLTDPSSLEAAVATCARIAAQRRRA
ncbi:4-hydroxythreonine-4-phosphate dehydrogenase PdxA [Pseudoxanthomonas sp. NC8]|nr:4-hydroxythreonine-4-phosphate dehydrogenase PdxA [Pseudoxanthomonas sp. NC8]